MDQVNNKTACLCHLTAGPFQTPFCSEFESVANTVFLFETNFGWRSNQGYQAVAILEGN